VVWEGSLKCLSLLFDRTDRRQDKGAFSVNIQTASTGHPYRRRSLLAEAAMMTKVMGLDTILELGLPDQAIQAEELPWVPQGERAWFKPLRFDLANGRWVNLLKVTGGGRVNRHRHSGGQVLGYCLQGSWHYLEREWVARPGTFVYEPPGDIHTLVVDAAEEMITLFLLEGVVQYLDDDDNVIYQDDVFTKLERYRDYCRRQGIEPQDLRY
jgi:anti-sigma factor ChrR (cupin superfamily)